MLPTTFSINLLNIGVTNFQDRSSTRIVINEAKKEPK